jgi:hypothetical protein
LSWEEDPGSLIVTCLELSGSSPWKDLRVAMACGYVRPEARADWRKACRANMSLRRGGGERSWEKSHLFGDLGAILGFIGTSHGVLSRSVVLVVSEKGR